MQKYSHLLFDHDGVLVNTEHLYYESTRQKLAELDIDLTRPIYTVSYTHLRAHET